MLAGGGRTLGRAEHRSWAESGSDSDLLVRDLEIVALVAIVDPPRSEARDAIAEAHAAGIDVKMITGDHGVTAAAIARDLGLGGGVLTGAELDHLDDAELSERLDANTVFARVSPEHKIRLVDLMQRRDAVVAMTGDGVNDAPALKKATIVGAAILGIADGAPFTAIAILWVNIVMDGPTVMAVGTLALLALGLVGRRPRPATRRDPPGPDAATVRHHLDQRRAVGGVRGGGVERAGGRGDPRARRPPPDPPRTDPRRADGIFSR